MVKIGFFAIFILLMNYSAPMAKIILLPLNEMVGNSELIIVGKVIRIETKTQSSQTVNIQVEEVLKGDKSLKQLEIFYNPLLSTEPKYCLGERAIMFLKNWEGRYTLVQGYAGKINIENNTVRPIYIRGEKKLQTYAHFIEKIMKFANIK